LLFFTNYITDENVYSNLLFNTLPFIFVGNINRLNSTYNTLNNLHITTYNIELETKIDDFWINSCDISNVLDVDKVIDNIDYAKNKGKLFIDLHNYFLENQLPSLDDIRF